MRRQIVAMALNAVSWQYNQAVMAAQSSKIPTPPLTLP